MATQSLYRRYRPRRFSELKGQEHVVRALRTSVAEGRSGQAYLFSGPRGTGKTTTARILAKVLNCTNPVDGEPCCECESCLAVERGTSYDVHELDAASNNGVDAMRDLIDKASLGTPGRHKVYILDEVHMLSNAAEAALLKTLEEPPPHVVFVLATTDPQKMSDTVRSRTQHLQFHLLPPDTLAEHVRWVAADAGLDVDDDAVAHVLARGGGSARDTLSALELVANAGGAAGVVVDCGDLVQAMTDRDPGAALSFVAGAITRGVDPRALTDEIVDHLRNSFLALMAPDLVLLPSDRVRVIAEQAQRLGAVRIVRGIELFGSILVEMRHAPNPRVLVDVAVVQLTSDAANDDVTALAARLERLERRFADAASSTAVGTPGPPAADQVPRRGAGGASTTGSAQPTPSAEGDAEAEPEPGARRAAIGAQAHRAAGTAAATPAATPAASAVAAHDSPSPDPGGRPVDARDAPVGDGGPGVESAPADAPPVTAQAPATDSHAPVADGPLPGDVWEEVRPTLRGLARPLFTSTELVTSDASSLTLRAPSSTHKAKCDEHRGPVEKALSDRLGRAISVVVVTGGGGDDPGVPGAGRGDGDARTGPPEASAPTGVAPSPPRSASHGGLDAGPGAVDGVEDVDGPVRERAEQRPPGRSVRSVRRAAPRRSRPDADLPDDPDRRSRHPRRRRDRPRRPDRRTAGDLQVADRPLGRGVPRIRAGRAERSVTPHGRREQH